VAKVRWHRKCYQDNTHSGILKRAKERFARNVAGPDKSKRKTNEALQVNNMFSFIFNEAENAKGTRFRYLVLYSPFLLIPCRDLSHDQRLLRMIVMFVSFVTAKPNINNHYI